MNMDHILIIENETELLRQYLFAFEQVNMRATGARNADEALNIINHCIKGKEIIDILLVSMHLEGMSAVEFISLLRKQSNPVPVVAIAANGTREMLMKLMQLHCVDFIETPVTFGLLYTRIEAALRQYRRLYITANDNIHS
jgi:DNA-binding NtrC family response regulator